MKYSIVIPAFNEEKLLADSLNRIKQSLVESIPPGHEYELILCDNNSTDRTAEIARKAGAKVVFEPVNQISRARNTGAAAANGDYLVFIDADSYPSPELFKELFKAIDCKNVVGGGALVYLQPSDIFSAAALYLWRTISCLCTWAAGSFVFCRRDIFIELGGFSTELYASEEIDFSKRLKSFLSYTKAGKATILRTAILTSDRKLKLYGSKDYLKLLWRLIFQGKKILRDPHFLHIWYDGRR